MDIIETEWIPLPDGTRLAARLFLPDTRPAPSVLEYLPYRRRDVTAARDEGTYPAYAKAGIAGVRVDLRGTGDSDGIFDDEYSEQELSDAEAVIAWIAEQPWSNGRVGMMGISWGGFNALQLAARRPPALKAVISVASTVDRFADDIHFKGGAMMGSNLYWATQMLGRAALPPDAAVVGVGWRKKWLERLENTPSLAAKWHREQARGPYWQHGSICEDFSAIDIPCLVIAGWADGYRNTPWKARAGMGNKVRALTGPWVHHYPHYGEPGPSVDFIGESIAWWQGHLANGPAPDHPPHRLWLSEAVRPGARENEPGRWIAISQDPAQETRTTLTIENDPPHLCFKNTQTTEDAQETRSPNAPSNPAPQAHSGAAAAGSEGPDGVSRRRTGHHPLQLKTPLHCGLDGGEYFTQSGSDLPGDQRADDALSAAFDTAPLETPLDIIGMPELTMPVAIDAPKGNLIARLCDVHPDGTAHRITLGVLNLSHRNGSEHPKPMTPGQEETVTLTLDATAYRLPKGHRLRLAISTNYVPLILPPPTEVTATIDLARTELQLPSHPFEEIDIPIGVDTQPKYETVHSPGETSATVRETSRDDIRPRRSSPWVHVEAASGRVSHPRNGLSWESGRMSNWRAELGDPSDLRGTEVFTAARWRDGVKTGIKAISNIRMVDGEWLIECSLGAFEGGQRIFLRTWTDRIPRDHA